MDETAEVASTDEAARPGHVDYPMTGVPDVPALWLDTHAISQIAESLEREAPRADDYARRALYDRLVALRQAGSLLIFESDQMWEIEVVPSLTAQRAQVLSALTLGVRTSYLDIQRQQMAVGMAACIGGVSAAQIPWAAVFTPDPFRDQSVNGLRVRVDVHPDEAEIERRVGSYREIAAKWEELRRNTVKSEQRQVDRLGRQIELELGGEAATVFHYAELYVNAVQSGQVLSTDELLVLQIHIAQSLAVWKHSGGESILDMVDFLHSAYYCDLPIHDVASQLRAWRITGNEEVESGDVMDVHHISALLPYCTHMVIDRSMIHAVRKLGLDSKYSTTVLRLSELSAVLDHLECDRSLPRPNVRTERGGRGDGRI